MSYKNGQSFTDFRSINLKAEGGLLRFEDITTAPTSTSGEYLLYVDGGVLYFDNGSSAVAVGAAGGSVGSLDGAYDGGRTIVVNQGSVVLSGVNEDTAVLSITGDGDSAGALLAFAHTTNTRKDIDGSGSTWFITGQGAATFTAIDMQDNELITFGTGNDATIGWNGSVLNVAGVVDFDNNVTLAASATITQTGVGGSTVLTITAGDAVMSDGSLSITDADNAETLGVINNTATTIGSGANTGLVQFSSTSLTTGTLLHLELTEGTLNGGHYMKCWDVTAGAAVFSVAEDGVLLITGTAGSNSITLTNGDVVVSDGSLSITDADNAESVTIINNTATTIGASATAGVVQIESTSLTTGAALNVQLTEGTLNGGFYYSAWDATAGARVWSIGEDGAQVIAGAGGSTVFTVTAGDLVVSDGSLLLTDADNAQTLGVVNNTATTHGSAAADGVVQFSSTSLTTGTLLHLELTEGTLNGGHYLKCWDVTGGATVLSIGEDGAINSAGGGTFTTAGAVVFSGTETIAAGGTSTALSLTKTVHYIDADAGGDTFTLADGTAGQIAYILLTSSTGVATVTPTNLAGGTSVTLNADGDSVILMFMDTEWFIIGGNSYAVV